MKWLVTNAGSTATPSSPRSWLTQARLGARKSSAVVNVPFWNTRNWPVCEVISRRPSGVKASAVGLAAWVTSVSLKPAGGAADTTAASASTLASTDPSKSRRRTIGHSFEGQVSCPHSIGHLHQANLKVKLKEG